MGAIYLLGLRVRTPPTGPDSTQLTLKTERKVPVSLASPSVISWRGHRSSHQLNLHLSLSYFSESLQDRPVKLQLHLAPDVQNMALASRSRQPLADTEASSIILYSRLICFKYIGWKRLVSTREIWEGLRRSWQLS